MLSREDMERGKEREKKGGKSATGKPCITTFFISTSLPKRGEEERGRKQKEGKKGASREKREGIGVSAVVAHSLILILI